MGKDRLSPLCRFPFQALVIPGGDVNALHVLNLNAPFLLNAVFFSTLWNVERILCVTRELSDALVFGRATTSILTF